jgi:hypothetical protein
MKGNPMPIGKARMSKLFTGRNVATVPIPRDVWSDDLREQDRNATQRQVRTGPQFGTGPTVGAPQVSGRKIRKSTGGSGFNPVSNSKQKSSS